MSGTHHHGPGGHHRHDDDAGAMCIRDMPADFPPAMAWRASPSNMCSALGLW